MAHKQAEVDYEYNDKLCYLGEWFEFTTSFHKNFLISFFPCDNTVELYDTDTNRMFLKRSACDGVTMKEVFVGNTVRIYGRQIKITDYADNLTRNIIGKTRDHTFAIIKPSAVEKMGEIISCIEDRQFRICRMRMCNVTRKEALDFYEFSKGDPFLPFMVEHLVSGPIIALELVGDDAIERWIRVLGPKDPEEARKTHPDSLRALYGLETASNGFHASEDHNQAVQNACFFFPQGIDKKPPPTTALMHNSTCCVIKPHALEEKKLGPILSAIMNSPKFKITAMQMFYLSTPNAEEFLEVYRGVISDFHALLTSFIDGPCVALEISTKQEGLDAHEEFRKFCGPSDSDIARQIRPGSLRGLFGVSKYKNAIHCTDLAEDTRLELEYFFKILLD